MMVRDNISKKHNLEIINNRISQCFQCPLHSYRTNTVPGSGNIDTPILFIGEGPGEQEDLKGKPFVGRSGELLDKAFEACGLKRSDIFITNIVKCRPPGNRNPLVPEMDACCHFLEEQIKLLNPQVIVVLGKVAAEYILKKTVFITRENGHIHFPEKPLCENNPLILTVFHPAYVLRNRKAEVEESFFQAINYAKEIAYGKL